MLDMLVFPNSQILQLVRLRLDQSPWRVFFVCRFFLASIFPPFFTLLFFIISTNVSMIGAISFDPGAPSILNWTDSAGYCLCRNPSTSLSFKERYVTSTCISSNVASSTVRSEDRRVGKECESVC